jgi:hypothetical protein
MRPTNRMYSGPDYRGVDVAKKVYRVVSTREFAALASLAGWQDRTIILLLRPPAPLWPILVGEEMLSIDAPVPARLPPSAPFDS